MSQKVVDLVNATRGDRRPAPSDLRGYALSEYYRSDPPLLVCQGDPEERTAWRTVTPMEYLQLYGDGYDSDRQTCPCGCRRRSARPTVVGAAPKYLDGAWTPTRWLPEDEEPKPPYDGPFLTVPTRGS